MNPPRPARDWITRLQIRHLDILAAIARTGSLSRTAELMAMSQPALSKWLKSLEISLGVALFERTTRKVTLTPYGRIVVRHAERVLGDMERTQAEIDSTRMGLAGRVVVGALPAAAPVLLPGALTRLHRPRIETQVQVHEGTLDRLLPLLQRRELDIIIGRIEGDALNLGLHCEVLYQEPICVAARAGHPLAGRKRLAWKDTAAYPWIVPPWNTPMRISLDLAFSRAGLPLPQAMMESASTLTNHAVAQRADCLFVASEQVVANYENEGLLCRLPLRLAGVPQDIGMLWADAPSPAMLQLIAALRAEAAAIAARPVEARAQRR